MQLQLSDSISSWEYEQKPSRVKLAFICVSVTVGLGYYTHFIKSTNFMLLKPSDS